MDELTQAIGNTAMAKMLREVALYLGKKIDGIATQLSQKQSASQVDIYPVVAAINALAAKEKDMEVLVNTSGMEQELRNTAAAMKQIPTTDTSAIESLLSTVTLAINENKKAIADSAKQIINAISGLQLQVPDVVRLDAMQVREIRNTRMPMNPAPLAARSVNVATLSMASANTEYSYKLSNKTTGYFIKLRTQNVLLYMATATGKLPTSGDGSAYMTIPQNGMLSPMNLDVGGQTLYFNTGSASQVVEIQEFIA